MAINYVGASEQQKRRLDQSLLKIRECIKKNKDLIPALLFKQLSDMLDSKETHIEIEIKGDEGLRVADGTRANWAYWGSGEGHYVEINSRCFDRWARRKGARPNKPPRLTAVLLHEMVHAAGGEELDAEFFENFLFGPQDGATLPSKDDEENFQESGYKGVFIFMDRNTREVRDLVSHKDLGKLNRDPTIPPIKTIPPESPILFEPRYTKGEEATMAGGNQQEKLAGKRIETMDKRKKQLGVHVVVEFTGYLDKVRLDTFMNGIRTTLSDHLEGNGGGG